MVVGQPHDTLPDQAVGCCHTGCFLFWTGRRHRERRRQGTTATWRPSTASKVKAASSASQGSGGQPLACPIPACGTGRTCVAEVAAEAEQQMGMMTTKESVKLPGGGSSILVMSPEFSFSTECSSSGALTQRGPSVDVVGPLLNQRAPLTLGPSVDAAGSRLKQRGGFNERSGAVHAKFNPLVTEVGRVKAGNITAALVTTTPATVTDDETAFTKSILDEEKTSEEVYKDSLCQPIEVLRLAKEAEQEALREMEQASAARYLLQQASGRRHQACGRKGCHQAIPLKSSVHQGRSAASRRASMHCLASSSSSSSSSGSSSSSSAFSSGSSSESSSRTQQVLEEGTDHDNDAAVPCRARRRRQRHAVLLDSSQVVSGSSVNCPFASVCLWPFNVCVKKEEVSEIKVSKPKKKKIFRA